MTSDYTKSIIRHYSFLKLLLLSTLSCFLLGGCITAHEPIERFKQKETTKKENIEEILSLRYGDSTYQSLAYGPLIVYKPESFKQLDSLYALKEDFIERNDLRGLETSNVEEKIPSYRAQAQQDIQLVQYEIEHIFSVKSVDSLTIHHSVFLYDYMDSLLSQDTLYTYSFPKKYEKMHINYLFEYHFLTKRDLYISNNERQFIQYFKRKEQDLAKSPSISSFMTQVLETMTLAQKINSVEYNELIKYKSIQNLKPLGGNITINEFGTLIALEKNNKIVGYEYDIRWQDNSDKIKKKSIFTYTPTLSLEKIDTTKE